MMKTVLWLCNRSIEGTADRRDGTWFTAMARALAESGKIRLAVVAQAKVKGATRCDFGDIAQWVVPYEPLGRNGLPSRRTIEAIQQAADKIKPDLIHVWGTENYWGLLTARGILSGPTVLDIQGIKYVCARVYYGGLSLAERIRCIGPLEILRPGSSFLFGKWRFERWGRFEKEMILKHKHISTQSDWVRAHMLTVNPGCTLFKTRMMLRREFFEASPWTPREFQDFTAPSVFTCSSGAVAHKGLHVLIRAIAILKRKYPRIVLNVAGDIMKKGIKRSGYARWLQCEARRLDIENNVHWLGPLDADEIIRQFYQASMVVISSFVESYSLVLAEAMLVGVPIVVSYAGAMPELARHEESVLFFPTGDESACAWQMDRILSDQALAGRLSQNARKTGLSRNEPRAVVERQIGIYNEILGRENEC
jgi:glycosyltransferase involved in cell wall biosynthesis